MRNKKTLKDISVGMDNRLLEKIKERNANRKLIRTQGRIALAILLRLDELSMSQTDLAKKLGVAKQYVNRLVKGKEKFGSEILVKLEEALDMPIFVQNLPQEKQELLKDRPKVTAQYEEELEIPAEVLLQRMDVYSLFNKRERDSRKIEINFPSESMINSTNFC